MNPNIPLKKFQIGGKKLKATESECNKLAKKYFNEPHNFWRATKGEISGLRSDSYSVCDESAKANKNKNICK